MGVRDVKAEKGGILWHLHIEYLSRRLCLSAIVSSGV